MEILLLFWEVGLSSTEVGGSMAWKWWLYGMEILPLFWEVGLSSTEVGGSMAWKYCLYSGRWACLLQRLVALWHGNTASILEGGPDGLNIVLKVISTSKSTHPGANFFKEGFKHQPYYHETKTEIWKQTSSNMAS